MSVLTLWTFYKEKKWVGLSNSPRFFRYVSPDMPIGLLHVATLLDLLFRYNKVTSKHQ